MSAQTIKLGDQEFDLRYDFFLCPSHGLIVPSCFDSEWDTDHGCPVPNYHEEPCDEPLVAVFLNKLFDAATERAEATLTRLLSDEAQKAAEAVLVELVGSNLAFNVAAYGKAWTGEGEDTEFLVGSAVLPALQAAINAVTNQEETTNGE